MKTLIIATGLAIVMYVVVVYVPSTSEVMKSTPETIVKVEKVDTLEDRIKNAQEAEMGQIEASAQEAYDAYVQKELKRIEDKVKIEYIGEIEQTIEDPAY